MNEEHCKCCIPRCKSSTKVKHFSLYRVKPEWNHMILNYINKRQRTKVQQWPCEKICGEHLKLCGIRNRYRKDPVYFPFLKVSISKFARQPALQCIGNAQYKTYKSDDIGLGSEITIPEIPETGIDLSKVRSSKQNVNVFKPTDHHYAFTPEYVNLLKEEYEQTKAENEMLKNTLETLTDNYEKEINRLNNVTHELVKSNLKNENTRVVEYPFRNIMDNERVLKFYTGFPTRKTFQNFANLMKPHYDLARSREKKDNSRVNRKHCVEYEQQLIIVLSRLRLGLLQHDLAYRFNISTTTVSSIWTFWINLLSDHLLTESIKLNEEQTCSAAELSYNHKIILECNETFFEYSSEQNVKISSNKTYTRAKGLIEVTPNGYITFVSNLYPGNVNEMELLQQSHVPKDVNSFQAKHQIGYGQNNNRTVNLDVKENLNKIGRFTALQIHIQRILGFIKGFKILKGTFPNSIYNQINLNNFWKICCYLINFTNKPLFERVLE